MHERCSVCGLKYLEDQGALFGTLFVVDRALFLFPLIVLVYFRAYVPHAATLFYVLCAVMLFLVIYTLPQRSGMALALDYHLRRRRGH